MSRAGFALVAFMALLGAAACDAVTGAEGTDGNDTTGLTGVYKPVSTGLQIGLPESTRSVSGAETSLWNYIEVVAREHGQTGAAARYWAASATKRSGYLYLDVPISGPTYDIIVLLGYQEGTSYTLLSVGFSDNGTAGYQVTNGVITPVTITSLGSAHFTYEFYDVNSPGSNSSSNDEISRNTAVNNYVEVPTGSPFWVKAQLDITPTTGFAAILALAEGETTKFTIGNSSLYVDILSDTTGYIAGAAIPPKNPNGGGTTPPASTTEVGTTASGGVPAYYVTLGEPWYYVAALMDNWYKVYCKLDGYYAYGLAKTAKRQDENGTPFIKWTIRNGLTDDPEEPYSANMNVVSKGGAVKVKVGNGGAAAGGPTGPTGINIFLPDTSN
jgi:phage tail protein X